MSLVKVAREARDAAIARVAWGESQNFLGARWVERAVTLSPVTIRERVALRLLSLSPHYFYDRNVHAEARRNLVSRQALADALVVPHLTSVSRVLDYGCGPGYMANAVAKNVDHVYAVDISRGVLACARVLNSGSNITYITPHELQKTGKVDLAYSFAVVQHLRTERLIEMLNLVAAAIRQDGVLLLHFALPGPQGWRTEVEWVADRSALGRAKLRYGLNCFGRSADDMETLVARSGFTDVTTHSLNGSVIIPGEPDITRQHWLTARRL
jgi:cyclopropane fatty-acyl-phospholipid synthase-like methyltransferase